MEKAKIYVLNKLNVPMPDQTIEVMYNPSEYTFSKTAKWPNEQFKGTVEDDFSVDLFFDTYEFGKDVREDNTHPETKKLLHGTKRIEKLTEPLVEGTDTKNPPICIFNWGKFNFTGVVIKVSQQFVMFLGTGIPVRAKVKVTFKQRKLLGEDKKAKGFTDSRKAREIRQGDRLDLIATEELNDASLWVHIAKENDIDNPLLFPLPEDLGRTLIIPDL